MECHTEADLVCAGKSNNTTTHIAIAVPVVVAVVVLIFICIYLRVRKPGEMFESKLKY